MKDAATSQLSAHHPIEMTVPKPAIKISFFIKAAPGLPQELGKCRQAATRVTPFNPTVQRQSIKEDRAAKIRNKQY
jgi:hypothetical protein